MIDTDLLKEMIQHLREVHSRSDVPNEEERGEDPLESSWDELDSASAGPPDPIAEQLVAIIDGLDATSRAELVALMWVGRGDFEARDWDEAMNEARMRGAGQTADYFLGTPLVVDYWISGAETLGIWLDGPD